MFCVTYFCFLAYGCAYLWNSYCSHARTKSVQRYKNFLTYASKNNKISLSHFFFHLHPALSLLSPPTLLPSHSTLTLPIIHSKIAVCFDTFPIHTRYIPDTYPIHTYTPWIPHEYPTNTPRIPHEYPTHVPKGLKKCIAINFSHFVSKKFLLFYPQFPPQIFRFRKRLHN